MLRGRCFVVTNERYIMIFGTSGDGTVEGGKPNRFSVVRPGRTLGGLGDLFLSHLDGGLSRHRSLEALDHLRAYDAQRRSPVHGEEGLQFAISRHAVHLQLPGDRQQLHAVESHAEHYGHLGR